MTDEREGKAAAQRDSAAAAGQRRKVAGLPRPPQVADEPAGAARGFIVTTLLVAVGVIMLVAAANAVVDPYATFGTDLVAPAVWTDRQEKVQLAGKLGQAPDVVIVGSSRAMKMQPSYIEQKTGLRTFNFAVSDGKAPDAYAIARFMHDRFPHHQAEYLWILDLETFSRSPVDARLLSTKQLAQYLPGLARAKGYAEDVATLLSWKTLAESWRSVRHAAAANGKTTPDQAGQVRSTPKPEFAPDGFRVRDFHDAAAARGRTLQQNLPGSIAQYGSTYRSRFKEIDPLARQYFERTIAQLNDWGVRPVLALSPVQPQLLDALDRLGYEKRRQEVLAYLDGLKKTHDFVLLDMTEVGSFGGTPSDFFDGVHMTLPNDHRLLDAILAGSGDALSGGSGSLTP